MKYYEAYYEAYWQVVVLIIVKLYDGASLGIVSHPLRKLLLTNQGSIDSPLTHMIVASSEETSMQVHFMRAMHSSVFTLNENSSRINLYPCKANLLESISCPDLATHDKSQREDERESKRVERERECKESKKTGCNAASRTEGSEFFNSSQM